MRGRRGRSITRVCTWTWSRTWVRTLWIQSKSTQFQRVCVCVSPKNEKKKKKETVPFRIVIFDGVSSFLPSLFLLFLWYFFFFPFHLYELFFHPFFQSSKPLWNFIRIRRGKYLNRERFWNRVCDFWILLRWNFETLEVVISREKERERV